MICVPISRSSRGSIAFTLPCVPTGMNTGVSTTPCAVVNRPKPRLGVRVGFQKFKHRGEVLTQSGRRKGRNQRPDAKLHFFTNISRCYPKSKTLTSAIMNRLLLVVALLLARPVFAETELISGR